LIFFPAAITNGIEVIRGIKTLGRIGLSNNNENIWPAAEFWKKYDAGEFKAK
jgi:hypothetical protein